MGVLDARKNAEKVSYPVVGEQIKDADNVIDYDIHEEITKDASNVMNANNQTTTGIANIIPGINAPKLIAETSIAGLSDIEQEGSYYGNVVVLNSVGTIPIPPGNTPTYTSNSTTISTNTLPYSFSTDSRGVVFPRGGGYSIEIRFFTMGQDEFTAHYKVYLDNTVICTYNGRSGGTSTYQVNVNKGQTLYFTVYVNNSFPDTSTTKTISVQYTITPK